MNTNFYERKIQSQFVPLNILMIDLWDVNTPLCKYLRLCFEVFTYQKWYSSLRFVQYGTKQRAFVDSFIQEKRQRIEDRGSWIKRNIRRLIQSLWRKRKESSITNDKNSESVGETCIVFYNKTFVCIFLLYHPKLDSSTDMASISPVPYKYCQRHILVLCLYYRAIVNI